MSQPRESSAVNSLLDTLSAMRERAEAAEAEAERLRRGVRRLSMASIGQWQWYVRECCWLLGKPYAFRLPHQTMEEAEREQAYVLGGGE